MAKTETASVVTLRQPVVKRPLTGKERTRNCRERKKAAEAAAVTLQTVTVTAPKRSKESLLLTAVAFGLTGTGICMNGWFSGSLGSTSFSGLVFLAIGICCDVAAFALPSRSARLWQSNRWTALTGWAVWFAIAIFVVMNAIGFTGTNIADVTLARADRVTPAVTLALTSLEDARGARDRECKSGIGKFCREREAAVIERQAKLDVEKRAVAETGDPQTEAATHMVAWASRGMLNPSRDDAAMLRLVLMALLSQAGGILLMIGRAKP